MDLKELDKYFDDYEGDVEELNREIFDKLTTPEELHYIAEKYNWDGGIEIMQWIAESELCSEATALMVFWLARPGNYEDDDYEEKSNDLDDPYFILIKTIYENYKKGFYKKTSIKYDPKEDMPDQIPDILYQETDGIDPVCIDGIKSFTSWFEESLKDITVNSKELIKNYNALYGEYAKNIILNCDNSMALYTIAKYLAEAYGARILFDYYKDILDNKYCDKGIALFIYRSLLAYNFDKKYIEDKIKNNEYKEVIKHKGKVKKWEIPEIMRREIK